MLNELMNEKVLGLFMTKIIKILPQLLLLLKIIIIILLLLLLL